MSKFEELLKKDYEALNKKKNGQAYLPWATAWSELKKAYPEAKYRVEMDENRNMAFGNSDQGYNVFTTITTSEEELSMHLPIMDFKNKALTTITQTDVNKAVMRCLVKNCALFGIGIYFYAGEEYFDHEIGKEKEDVQAELLENAKKLKELGLFANAVEIIGYGGFPNKIKTVEEAKEKLIKLEELLAATIEENKKKEDAKTKTTKSQESKGDK